MERFKLVLGVVIALLALIIVLQNTETVETRLLFITISMPRAVLLFGTTLIGFALGVLASFSLMKKRR